MKHSFSFFLLRGFFVLMGFLSFQCLAEPSISTLMKPQNSSHSPSIPWKRLWQQDFLSSKSSMIFEFVQAQSLPPDTQSWQAIDIQRWSTTPLQTLTSLPPLLPQTPQKVNFQVLQTGLWSQPGWPQEDPQKKPIQPFCRVIQMTPEWHLTPAFNQMKSIADDLIGRLKQHDRLDIENQLMEIFMRHEWSHCTMYEALWGGTPLRKDIQQVMTRQQDRWPSEWIADLMAWMTWKSHTSWNAEDQMEVWLALGRWRKTLQPPHAWNGSLAQWKSMTALDSQTPTSPQDSLAMRVLWQWCHAQK